MGILAAIVMGAIVGMVARMVVPSTIRGGCLVDVAIGIIGSVIGSFIFQLFGHTGLTGFSLHSFFVSLVGAIVFLVGARAVSRSR